MDARLHVYIKGFFTSELGVVLGEVAALLEGKSGLIKQEKHALQRMFCGFPVFSNEVFCGSGAPGGSGGASLLCDLARKGAGEDIPRLFGFFDACS